MPRFFFNLHSHGGFSADETGTEFSSLDAAYLDTCDAILDMAIEKLRAHRNPANDMFEIADERGNVLMEVTFSEILSPAAATKRPMNLETVRIFDSCRRHAARSLGLTAEIRAEFEQVRNTFCDIRANLARITARSSW
ncbi:hypothetical protein [Bradyrhizobium sp. Tv2a-2]|uniref:DUF6894 family protein n=1 Tax=Bradyrhizobium sp. Tv2a-2 TaxID=113395 RepID=UPI000426D0C6|nr:hypothetical protein [Bradyrhizobium sp. Tv2a-2]